MTLRLQRRGLELPLSVGTGTGVFTGYASLFNKRDGAIGFNISWIRRTRIDGDLWELAEVPLGEASEQYRLEICAGATLKRSLVMSAPNYFYTSADFTTDFGASPAAVKLRVAQISAVHGAGDFLERIFNA